MRGPCRREILDRIIPSGEEGAAQRVLLLVLLLVVVLFGYLYFFTGMIKAREEAIPPAVVASVTKKPLPPRPGAEESAGAAGEKAKPAAGAVPEPTGNVTAITDGGKTAPAKPEVAPAKKEQPVPPKPVPAAQPPKAVPPAKVIPEKKDQQKAAPLPAVTPKKAGGAESIPEKVAPAKRVSAQYALFAGEFILDENLKNTQRQLKKAGIQTFSVSTRTKSEPMHRVRLGEFPSRTEAETELKKFQKAAGAAFILPNDGKYTVYAGSYFNAGQAVREKDRLSSLVPGGMSVTVEKADVNVPVKRLTAGAFPDKETALAEAARLKKRGITASIVPLRKAGR